MGRKHAPGKVINKKKALPNNKNPEKLKTDDLKREAYDSYCAHLAKGKSPRSWWFKKGSLTLTWESMERYIREYPSVLDPLKKSCAKAEGFAQWEQVCEDGAKGLNKDVNTATLQMLMRNKFGWDKETQSEKGATQPLVQQLLNHWNK